jgi:hypothetical protein
MPGKYWMHPDYVQSLQGLDQPLPWHEFFDTEPERSPNIWHDEIPTNEWYWFDADNETLSINVHQSYFDIANAARSGGVMALPLRQPDYVNRNQLSLGIQESLFRPETNLDNPEWASFVLRWSDAFSDLTDDTNQVHVAANDAIHELDSIVFAVSHFRFEVPTLTPQLIDTFGGLTLTLTGVLSPLARDGVIEKAMEGLTETAAITKREVIYYAEGSDVLNSIGRLLFSDQEISASGIGLFPDGRFVSNTGVVMGTGSLEVMPDEVRNGKGYRYSSHNLDGALTQLWAFGGLARLIGDTHRHYEAEAKV